jgi:hypothetical protein
VFLRGLTILGFSHGFVVVATHDWKQSTVDATQSFISYYRCRTVDQSLIPRLSLLRVLYQLGPVWQRLAAGLRVSHSQLLRLDLQERALDRFGGCDSEHGLGETSTETS